jgi:hypothetical protein
MIRSIAFLFLTLWTCATAEAHPNVEIIFPDYIGIQNAEHYEVIDSQVSFLMLDEKQEIPAFQAWVRDLKSVDARDGTLQLSVLEHDDKVRFIRVWSKKLSDHYRLFRVSQDTVELILPKKDGSGLWTNELGYFHWIWRYDQTGKFLKKEHVR